MRRRIDNLGRNKLMHCTKKDLFKDSPGEVWVRRGENRVQKIDESNSLAELKSPLLYSHTKCGEGGGEAVEVKVGRRRRWNYDQSWILGE